MAADQDCLGTLLDVTYVLQLQPEVRLEYISESVVDLTGYRQGDYTANPRLWLGAVDPRDRELMLAAFNAAPSTPTMMNLRVRTRAGGSVWVHQIARTVVKKGDVLLLCGGLTADTRPVRARRGRGRPIPDGRRRGRRCGAGDRPGRARAVGLGLDHVIGLESAAPTRECAGRSVGRTRSRGDRRDPRAVCWTARPFRA